MLNFIKLSVIFVSLCSCVATSQAQLLELLHGQGTVSVFDTIVSDDLPEPKLFIDQDGHTLPYGGVRLDAIATSGGDQNKGIRVGINNGSMFWNVDRGVTGIGRINIVGPKDNSFFVKTVLSRTLEIRGYASRYIAPGELTWFFNPMFSFSEELDVGDFTITKIFGNNRGNSNGFYELQTFANFKDAVSLDIYSVKVPVVAIPEPAIWQILLLGMFGMFGFILYKKKSK